MTTRITCPECKGTSKTAQEPPVGAKLKCSKCQKVFRYSPELIKTTVKQAAASTVQSEAKSAPAAPIKAAAVPPNHVPKDSEQRGSRLPLVIALICLMLVLGGTAYFMREPIREMLASSNVNPQKDKSRKSGDGTTTRSTGATDSTQTGQTDQTDKTSSSTNGTGAKSAKKFALPSELNGGMPFDSLAFSSDQKTLACAGSTTLQLWDLIAGKKAKTLPYSPGFNLRMFFSPDGQVLATVSENQGSWNCKLWFLPDGIEIADFNWKEEGDGFEENYQPPAAFSKSSELFAVPGDNHVIIVWDLTQAKQRSRLVGHEGRIDDLVFTKDGKKLLSGSGDYNHKSVRLWSLDGSGTGRELTSDKLAYQCLLAGEEKFIVTRGDMVDLWNLSPDGSLSLNQHVSDLPVKHIELWPDDKTVAMVVPGTDDAEVILWDIQSKKVKKQINLALGPYDQITKISFSPDGKTIASMHKEGLSLHDAQTGQVRAKYQNASDASVNIFSYALDVDGGILAMSKDNGKLRLESTTGGSAGAAIVSDSLATIAPKAAIIEAAFSADGKSVFTSLRPGELDTADAQLTAVMNELSEKYQKDSAKWQGATPAQRARFEVDFFLKNMIPRIQPIAERQQWSSVAAVWDIASPSQPRRLIRQPLLNEKDFDIELANNRPIQPGRPYGKDLLNPNRGIVDALSHYAFADSGMTQLMWLNRTEGFQLTDFTSGKDVTVTHPPRQLGGWRLSPDGTVLAAIVSDGEYKNWRLSLLDIERAEERLSLPYAGQPPTGSDQLCFSPDGVSFATFVPAEGGETKYIVKVWDTATGRQMKSSSPIALTELPETLEFSPDGTMITFPGGNFAAYGPQVADLITGQMRPTSVGEVAYLSTFAPDSESIACVQQNISVGESKNTILIVDLMNGQVRKSISGFTTIVQTMAYSPDGTLLAVGGGQSGGNEQPGSARKSTPYARGAASELKLFDVKTGDTRVILGGHSDLVTQVSFSNDGKLLSSVAWDGTVRIWNVAQLLKASNTVAPGPVRPTLAKIQIPKKAGARSQAAAVADSQGSSLSSEAIDAEMVAAQNNTLGVYLTLIQPGKFQMGSAKNDSTAYPNEKPQREVKITRPFAIGTFEITIAQFRSFADSTGYHTDAESGDGGTGFDVNTGEFIEEHRSDFNWRNTGWEQSDAHPVVNVSWNDATAFCEWLSSTEGVTFRLPTEAEWEYACRAGTKTRFWTGDKDASLNESENIGDASLLETWTAANWTAKWNDGNPFTVVGGSFKFNAWYLFDMHGNVAEWVGDSTGEHRILRGGSWYSAPRDARSAYRASQHTPDERGADTGFRVVRELGS